MTKSAQAEPVTLAAAEFDEKLIALAMKLRDLPEVGSTPGLLPLPLIATGVVASLGLSLALRQPMLRNGTGWLLRRMMDHF
jgi:hypothetical protein